MAIVIRCGQCGKNLRVADDAAGKQGKCPHCGALIQIPTPEPPVAEPLVEVLDEPILVQCGQCGKNLRVPAEAAGKKGKCPSCGTLLEIPSRGAAVPAEKKLPKPTPKLRGQTRLVGFRDRPRKSEERKRGTAKLGASASRRRTTRVGARSKKKGVKERVQKGRKFEYDPEKAARKKKRQLIVMCIIGGALLVFGITYHIIFVSPVQKKKAEFSRLLDDAYGLLEAFNEQVKRIKSTDLPETPTLVEKISKAMKSDYKDFEERLKKSEIYEIVGNYRLFKLLAELPKIPDDMIRVLQKVVSVEKEAEEDEWSEERLTKRRYELHTDFIDGYHRLKVKLRTALMYHNAMQKAMNVHTMSKEGWQEWLKERYRAVFGRTG